MNVIKFSFLFLVFTLSACGGGDSSKKVNDTNLFKTTQLNSTQIPLASLRLKQAQSCTEFKNYVVNSIIKSHTTISRYASCGVSIPIANPIGSPVAGAPAPEKTSITTPDAVSDTNNQVAGVNEGDIVKADDRGYVYIASGRFLVIAKGFPPQDLTTLKEINLDGHVTDLFLDKKNNRIIVISRFETPNVLPVASTGFAPAPVQGATDILFLDVTTPATPTIIKQLRLKGYFQTGRRINNRLHLILRNSNNFYALLDTKFWTLSSDFRKIAEQVKCDTKETDPAIIANNPKVLAAKKALTENVTKAFEAVTMSDYLPTAQQVQANNKLVDLNLLACTDIQHPEVSSNLAMQVINSMDTDGANLSATALVNNAWQTYVSKNNIYIAETSRNWWWDVPAPNSIIPTSQTAIYKFAISDQKPSYTATGTIEGYTRNQFSFSEFNGDLRVATTQENWIKINTGQGDIVNGFEPSNNIFILRDNGNRTLEKIGEVRNFGKTENIRSSRFLGSRAFVVTFRNIDPLFTFDLSVPEAPVLMGELSIPGFSSYMHPFDDTHLITIGRAGGNGGTGVGNGVQLQLFDISDLSNPTQVQSFIPNVPTNWSWSSAEYDHKAFTFYKPKNLLAIPMQIYGSKTTTGFSGIYAFNVSIADGFTLLGKVDHADLALQYYCNTKPADPTNDQYGCKDGSYVRWAAPRRSIVMTKAPDVYLYTISDVGMKAGNVTDLTTTLGSILLPEQAYPWWYTIGIGGSVVF
ncbi:MAG: beta-propeller domain-containing protein [Thiohalomonadales bacterium]